jgi:2-polyprenyl-3-methyl-5-hydroxy-6-metoxy-1,4-benzoquinol methylase
MLITPDDFIEIYVKAKQRGIGFILSKLNLIPKSRTLSAFNHKIVNASNWHDNPLVKKRINKLVSGDENISPEKYAVLKYLNTEHSAKAISIGSGNCMREIQIAKLCPNITIACYDMAEKKLERAREIAEKESVNNLNFYCADLNTANIGKELYDFVLFNSSLHHFNNISEFIPRKIKPILKDNGLVIINEYVGKNRLIIGDSRLKSVNAALKKIPLKYRKRYETEILKNDIYGPGLIRMIISDPSEAVDSESIIPTLTNEFFVNEIRPYGGNLLMPVLKDIAHWFRIEDMDSVAVLDSLFKLEDEYIENTQSDFVFGVFSNIK